MGLFKKKTYAPRRRRQPDAVSDNPASSSNRVFQRNRTITGSVSDRLNVTSHKTDLESPRTKAHHLAITRRKVGYIFLVVSASSLLLLWLLTQFGARATINISDQKVSSQVDYNLYQEAVQNYLGANPMQRFRFALDKSQLLASINKDHPEVGSIDLVEMGSAIGEVKLTISMREPVASWAVNSTKYYVDSSGIAFHKNYYSLNVVAITDESGIGIEQGTAIASNRFLSFVGKVVAVSKDNKYTVIKATIPSGTTRQLNIKLKNVRPEIRLSIDRPVGEQVEDTIRTLKYLGKRGRAASYIDVRVAGKAFYK